MNVSDRKLIQHTKLLVHIYICLQRGKFSVNMTPQNSQNYFRLKNYTLLHLNKVGDDW